MKYSKYSVVTLRLTEEEKNILENHSFMSGLSQSDIIREGLKLYFKDAEAFETTQERKEQQLQEARENKNLVVYSKLMKLKLDSIAKANTLLTEFGLTAKSRKSILALDFEEE